MTINNAGTGAAENIVFEVRKPFDPSINDYAFDMASVVVDSAGVLLSINPILLSSKFLPSHCNPPNGPLAREFLVTIPSLGPSQSVDGFLGYLFL